MATAESATVGAHKAKWWLPGTDWEEGGGYSSKCAQLWCFPGGENYWDDGDRPFWVSNATELCTWWLRYWMVSYMYFSTMKNILSEVLLFWIQLLQSSHSWCLVLAFCLQTLSSVFTSTKAWPLSPKVALEHSFRLLPASAALTFRSSFGPCFSPWQSTWSSEQEPITKSC